MQIPGNQYLFNCGHSGILPDLTNTSNNFAKWHKLNKGNKKGFWVCKICCKQYQKEYFKTYRNDVRSGVHGLEPRLKEQLRILKNYAKWKGYLPPDTTVEKAITLWNYQNNKCASCQKDLDFYSKNCHLDHNHVTGKVRGFLCKNCNMAEGLLKDFTEEELNNFIKFLKSTK